jgi:hypothetical protein
MSEPGAIEFEVKSEAKSLFVSGHTKAEQVLALLRALVTSAR